jgi:diguanylate cyclase (GGDEF)-like protein
VTDGVTAGLDVLVRPLAHGEIAVFDEAPDAIVIEAGDAAADAVIELLGALAGRATGPVLVTSPNDGMAVRLAVARCGAIGPLMAGHPTSAILERAVAAMASRDRATASLLVVDSDPYSLQSATLILEQAGHRVHAIDHPLGFWETLDTVTPDLVILGAAMTGVTGLDLCRALRADPRWRELSVVFMASADEASLVKEVYHAGGDDIVRKPLQREELIARVENRLQRARQLRPQGEADGLTGLPGRQKAERDIERFVQLARRHRHEVTLVALRLDRYAETVQRVGQGAVDSAVLAFSQVLQHSFRSEDVVSQWGPNEFVVGLFDANGANASVRVREVMTALRSRRFPTPLGGSFSLTCSAGLAAYPEDGADVRELHDAADAALMAAGSAGVEEALGVASDPNSRATGRVDVLLVEDDAAVASLLVHALESRQYQVRWLRSGQEAATALLGDKPAIRARLILLEVNLPELDGLALLRSLSEQDVLRHTRVIVLSSRTTEAETVQAFELGAFDYVAKPFSVAVLTERIRRALRA